MTFYYEHTASHHHCSLTLLISAPRLGLGVCYFLSLTPSVCPSVCLSRRNYKLILLFLFLDGIETFFWPSVPQNLQLHKSAYKSAFMADRPEMFGPNRGFSGMADSMEPCKMLWGRPLLPRQRHFGSFCTKSPITQLVRQIDRRCLGLPGVFRGWPIQRNHAKCCGADPCCHGNKILARRGDPVAYRLVSYYDCQQVSSTVASFFVPCLGCCVVLKLLSCRTMLV